MLILPGGLFPIHSLETKFPVTSGSAAGTGTKEKQIMCDQIMPNELPSLRSF
jgi:hypothetical protein